MILPDVVLGHGAEDDPAAGLAPAIAGGSVPPATYVVVACVGTSSDQQACSAGGAGAAGAEVHLSNAAAAPARWSRHRSRPMNPSQSPRPRFTEAGADKPAHAVAAQAVPVERVAWQPPMDGTADGLPPSRRTRCAADANALAGLPMLDAGAARRRRPRPRAARPGEGSVPARRPADRVVARPGLLRGALMGAAA